MQNIVTWGQNMSANIEEFACISMGGLFSGVPPYVGRCTNQSTTNAFLKRIFEKQKWLTSKLL